MESRYAAAMHDEFTLQPQLGASSDRTAMAGIRLHATKRTASALPTTHCYEPAQVCTKSKSDPSKEQRDRPGTRVPATIAQAAPGRKASAMDRNETTIDGIQVPDADAIAKLRADLRPHIKTTPVLNRNDLVTVAGTTLQFKFEPCKSAAPSRCAALAVPAAGDRRARAGLTASLRVRLRSANRQAAGYRYL